MHPDTTKNPASPDVATINRTFYDALWRKIRLKGPDGFNTWPIVSQLELEKSGAFGMQPASHRLVKYGMWWLEHRRAWAMFWYNWVGMPLAMFFQKRLDLVSGLIDTTGIDEMVVLCRRGVRSSPPDTGAGAAPVGDDYGRPLRA